MVSSEKKRKKAIKTELALLASLSTLVQPQPHLAQVGERPGGSVGSVSLSTKTGYSSGELFSSHGELMWLRLHHTLCTGYTCSQTPRE